MINLIIRNRRKKSDGIFTVLLDTGANKNLATEEAVLRPGLKIKKDRKQRQYDTATGVFATNQKAGIRARVSWS
jgi:hypothetical protein